ncbi:hypothetical protein IY145_22365 [Methylosinus sp. H3A]|uniref:hypothetical protein n=1 Tax=Methylosinus sp. H3A TaxID=2785786 RepID=UPI0018C28490|nr:hypothetical protein [Methylosinus sp. H3A]MBG0812090.1 hypothetical protein [Methylosinus sp. H3A]
MESIKTWFQDWSDACEYAKECAPDLSFLPGEPFTALFGIGAVCFLVWWWNERSLRAQMAIVASTWATPQPVEAHEGLTAVLDRARAFFPAALKRAA